MWHTSAHVLSALQAVPPSHQVSYLVEPAAVEFLLRHGFDFNRQYSKGLPYMPPSPTTRQQVRSVCGLSTFIAVYMLAGVQYKIMWTLTLTS